MTIRESSQPAKLSRQLGTADAAAIYVGIILGSGIFVAPAIVADATSSASVAGLLWTIGALVAAAGAFSYAECGSRLPETGGFYVYYRAAFGEGAAFVGGWAALLITYPASIAAIAHVFAGYLIQVVPAAEVSASAMAALAILFAGGFNALGVRTGANLQRALTATKVLALAALCVAALTSSASAELSEVTQVHPVGSWTLVLTAMVVLLWTYDGWSDVTLITGELRRPSVNLGQTVLLGTFVLALLYIMVQTAVLTLLPAERAASSEDVVSEAVRVAFGPHAGKLVASLVVVSTLGALNGVVLTGSRLGYAMASDGTFLRYFSWVHPSRKTPQRSMAALVVASLVYVFAGDFRELLSFFSFNVWIFYGTTAVALLLFRHRRLGDAGALRLPGGRVAPFIVLITAISMISGLIVQNPVQSFTGLSMLLAGVPIYLLWRLVRRRYH